MTKEAAYGAMVDVINLLEGKRIAADSVKSAYVDIHKTYDWAKRPIDLSRLSRVLAQPKAKYLAVWKNAIKSPARVTSTHPMATTDSACTSDKLRNWKPLPKCAGPDGPIAKWQKTGVPPNPDELPFLLAPWTRAQFYRIFDGSQNPPPRRAHRREGRQPDHRRRHNLLARHGAHRRRRVHVHAGAVSEIDHFHPLANQLIGLAAIGLLIVYLVWVGVLRARRAPIFGNFKLPAPLLRLDRLLSA